MKSLVWQQCFHLILDLTYLGTTFKFAGLPPVALAAISSKAVVLLLSIVTHIVGFCNRSVLLCVTLCPFYFFNHLDGEERTGCFALFVFLVSRDCCVALPHDAMGLSAFCDYSIS